MGRLRHHYAQNLQTRTENSEKNMKNQIQKNKDIYLIKKK